jgi:hypothetical protein
VQIYLYTVYMYTNIIMTFLPRAYPLFFFVTVHNCDVFRYSQGSLFNGERKSVTQFDGTFTLAEKKPGQWLENTPNYCMAASLPPKIRQILAALRISFKFCL